MKKNTFTSVKSIDDVKDAKKNYKKIFLKLEKLRFKKFNNYCPFCKSKERKIFFNYFNSKYYDCMDCHSIYFSPKLEKKGIKKFYELSNSFNLVNDIPKKFEMIRKKKLMEPRVKKFMNHLQTLQVKLPVKNLLEIGSGIGYFAEVCKKYKLSNNITLIEPDKFGHSIAKTNNPTFECHNTTFEKVNLKRKYDLIFINSVIEHPYNMDHFFSKLKQTLKHKGYVCLTDMNAQGIDIRILKEKTPNVNPYSILQVASTLGLKKILNKYNLKIEQYYHSGSLDSDIIFSVLNKKNASKKNKELIDLLNTQNRRSKFQNFLINNHLTGYVSYLITHK